MRKKILFVIPSMRIGGIENSLKNLLNNIDYSLYDITVFVFHLDEKQIVDVDKRVSFITGGFLLDTAAMSMDEAKKGGISRLLFRAVIGFLCKYLGALLVYKIIFMFESDVESWDYAISYSNNVNIHSAYFGANSFTLNKVKAKQKISWLHVDYDAMQMNNSVNNDEYENFDYVIAVSDAVKKTFLKYHPTMSNRTIRIYNNLNSISKNKHDCIQKDYRKKIIVTVGRLDPNKNQEEAIKIAEKLKNDGIEFKWFLVGDGQERVKLERIINEKNLKDVIEITGYKQNVQQYLELADLFVSTSLSESYGMAIVEAQDLGVPVVAHTYPAISEIIDGKNGMVAYSYDEMYWIVYDLLKNVEKLNILKRNTKVLHSNSDNLNDLYKILL